MIANYHTHTTRCYHASGTEREYIERAIAGGFSEIGFSDHAPMPFENGYISGFRMEFDKFEEYCNTLSALKKEYASQINVRIGLETEYYPKLFPTFIEKLKGSAIEYLILGQHYINNETDGAYCGRKTEKTENLIRYVDQMIEGLETGKFTYFAHPDIFNYVGDPDIRKREYTRLCKRVKALNIPMEINFLGIWDNRHYPSSDVMDIMSEVGNTVIFGCDAHKPNEVWQPDTEKRALELVAQRNLTLIQTIELKNPWM